MAKNKKETLYSISVNGEKNRSLLWCDEHWYETDEGQNFVFTKQQVEEIKAQLPKHFILKAVITDSNGEVEKWTAFKEKAAARAEKQALSEVELTFSI